MHYKELITGVNLYVNEGKINRNVFPKNLYDEEKIGMRFYSELVAEGRSCDKLAEDIEYLLINWNRRVPVDRSKIRKAVKKVTDEVKTWDLVKMNLWEHHKEIIKIFRIFIDTAKPNKNGKPKNNYTGASKALHIINPKFFIMWDTNIRDKYGCRENEEGYFNSLLRCQWEINEIISTYQRDYPLEPEISKMIYKGPPKSILKLLDECNSGRYAPRKHIKEVY